MPLVGDAPDNAAHEVLMPSVVARQPDVTSNADLMRMTNVLIVFVVFGATMLGQGATRKVDFSDDPIGQPAKGFEFAHTAKAGAV